MELDFNLIWQALLIFVVATFLLRIGGRKTISQMTIPQTVIMIAIGTLLIQPVAGNGLGNTFMVAGLLIIFLMVTEYIQLKFDKTEGPLSGKAVPVIENGTLNERNLRKYRLTVDKLEERLRQAGIANISDVQYGTLESNGQLGYTLKPNKQPATKQDIQDLYTLISTNNSPPQQYSYRGNSNTIFTETVQAEQQEEYKGEKDPEIPKHLQ